MYPSGCIRKVIGSIRLVLGESLRCRHKFRSYPILMAFKTMKLGEDHQEVSEDQDKAQSLELPNKRRSLPERLRAYALSDMLRTSIAGEDEGETENWRPLPVGPLGQVFDTTMVNLRKRFHPSLFAKVVMPRPRVFQCFQISDL